MKKTMMKLVALLLMLCMIVPYAAAVVPEGTTCYITVSITDDKEGKRVYDESSKYLTGASPLAIEVVELIEANYDEMEIFGSPEMRRIMNAGLAAFPDDAQWEAYLDTHFENVKGEIKEMLKDKTTTLNAMTPRLDYRMTFKNEKITDRKYGTTYTVTITMYLDGMYDADPTLNGLDQYLDVKGDHIAYIRGDDLGLVEPDHVITRAEAAQMYYNLLVNKDVAVTKTFDDVAADAWYAPAVNTIASLGIINGVDETNYNPEGNITRAEFIALLARFATTVEGKNTYSDLSYDHWAYDEILTAIGYGWAQGYPDGTFRPDDLITRAEAATLVCNALNRQPDAEYIDANLAQLNTYPDLQDKTYWAYYPLMDASNGHTYEHTYGGVEYWTGLLDQ